MLRAFPTKGLMGIEWEESHVNLHTEELAHAQDVAFSDLPSQKAKHAAITLKLYMLPQLVKYRK